MRRSYEFGCRNSAFGIPICTVYAIGNSGILVEHKHDLIGQNELVVRIAVSKIIPAVLRGNAFERRFVVVEHSYAFVCAGAVQYEHRQSLRKFAVAYHAVNAQISFLGERIDYPAVLGYDIVVCAVQSGDPAHGVFSERGDALIFDVHEYALGKIDIALVLRIRIEIEATSVYGACCRKARERGSDGIDRGELVDNVAVIVVRHRSDRHDRLRALTYHAGRTYHAHGNFLQARDVVAESCGSFVGFTVVEGVDGPVYRNVIGNGIVPRERYIVITVAHGIGTRAFLRFCTYDAVMPALEVNAHFVGGSGVSRYRISGSNQRVYRIIPVVFGINLDIIHFLRGDSHHKRYAERLIFGYDHLLAALERDERLVEAPVEFGKRDRFRGVTSGIGVERYVKSARLVDIGRGRIVRAVAYGIISDTRRIGSRFFERIIVRIYRHSRDYGNIVVIVVYADFDRPSEHGHVDLEAYLRDTALPYNQHVGFGRESL